MAKARKPARKAKSRWLQRDKRFPHPGRQSKRDLEAWFGAIQMMLHEIIRTWPHEQQAELLDGLQQLFVQRLNLWRERQDKR